MESFGIALGSGIVAALTATALWVVGISRLRPKIEISKVISHAVEDGTRVYRVKIINKGRRALANVRCEMDLLASRNVKGGQVEVRKSIKLRTNGLISLPGRRRKDKEFQNIFRFGTDVDLNELWDDHAGQRIAFRVFAQDAVSRVGKPFQQHYNNKATDLAEGVFAYGESFEVTPTAVPPTPPWPKTGKGEKGSTNDGVTGW